MTIDFKKKEKREPRICLNNARYDTPVRKNRNNYCSNIRYLMCIILVSSLPVNENNKDFNFIYYLIL